MAKDTRVEIFISVDTTARVWIQNVDFNEKTKQKQRR